MRPPTGVPLRNWPAARTVIFGIPRGHPMPVLPTCRDDYFLASPESPCMTKNGEMLRFLGSKASFIQPEKLHMDAPGFL